jgi:hypothetical protein
MRLLRGVVSYDGGGITLNGVDGFIEADSSPENSLTGEFEIICRLKASDWVPSGLQSILSKRGVSTNNGFRFAIIGSLGIGIYLYSDGVSGQSIYANLSVIDGETNPIWFRVRVTNEGSNTFGASFEYSTEQVEIPPVSWTSLVDNGPDPMTFPFYESTQPLRIGSTDGHSGFFDGTIYFLELYDGIGGTLVAKLDPSDGTSPIYNNVAGQPDWEVLDDSDVVPYRRVRFAHTNKDDTIPEMYSILDYDNFHSNIAFDLNMQRVMNSYQPRIPTTQTSLNVLDSAENIEFTSVLQSSEYNTLVILDFINQTTPPRSSKSVQFGLDGDVFDVIWYNGYNEAVEIVIDEFGDNIRETLQVGDLSLTYDFTTSKSFRVYRISDNELMASFWQNGDPLNLKVGIITLDAAGNLNQCDVKYEFLN